MKQRTALWRHNSSRVSQVSGASMTRNVGYIGLGSIQSSLRLIRVLRIVNRLRIAATRASFFGFPLASRSSQIVFARQRQQIISKVNLLRSLNWIESSVAPLDNGPRKCSKKSRGLEVEQPVSVACGYRKRERTANQVSAEPKAGRVGIREQSDH